LGEAQQLILRRVDTVNETIRNLEGAILTYYDVPRKEAEKLSRFLHTTFNQIPSEARKWAGKLWVGLLFL
jgi:hypothetical protein